jgi:large subunit ribosomal protein L21
MYAVVKTSGRQYRVVPGDSFSVEKLDGAPGTTLDLTEVLMIGGEKTVLGNPFVSGAKVTVVVEEQFRGPKIIVFKKKRRHKYRKIKGHRSELTRLFVSEISGPSGSAKAETKPHVLAPLAERMAKSSEKKAAKVKMAASEGGEAKAAPKKMSAGGAKKKSSSAKKSPKKKKSSTKSKAKK